MCIQNGTLSWLRVSLRHPCIVHMPRGSQLCLTGGARRGESGNPVNPPHIASCSLPAPADRIYSSRFPFESGKYC